MTKEFSELRARMTPEAQARSAANAQVMLAAIAKMEKRTDMYLST